MANSKQLRENKKQHQPKNVDSKKSDRAIYDAMRDCIDYLQSRLGPAMDGYSLRFEKSITFEKLIKVIRDSKTRKEFDSVFNKKLIRPDGGVIYLLRDCDPDFARIILVSEVKRQGTNDMRKQEGKPPQAQGNAIERLGKNLTGIRAALNHEPITPFVCFGHGCDFVEDYGGDATVMAKISMMNEFYALNRTYVFKRDGSSDKNHFAPVSMYFREEEWTQEEMFEILKEIGETAIRYYIF